MGDDRGSAPRRWWRAGASAVTKWILLECFSGFPGRVIAVGSAPKSFVPLTNIVRNPSSLADAESALRQACATGVPVAWVSGDGRRTVRAEPLLIAPRKTHAVRLWVGPRQEAVAAADPMGAWHFDLTTNRSVRSTDLLDLYGVAPRDRAAELAIAGAFTRLVTNRDESEALAKIVNSAPGTEHQAVWTIRRDDGALRAGHFACRIVTEPDDAGEPHVLLRGVTQDIGASTAVSAAPPPAILEYAVLEAATEPGEYRAIVNLRSLRLIRWIGPPMPDIAWEDLPGQPRPQIHPDDLAAAKTLSRDLARHRTEGTVRLRRLDGGWQPVRIRAALMALDQHTTAGLATVTVV
ncbi:GAF domain-containing protein [Nocardia niwae]|uniref:GAF domain-containing protein n=1 Tax=Nocardia niwae TaxID=626084 RepID=UPI0007A4EFA4|nr:GAF domain-containing protein [Nocardia niwae]